MHVDSSGRISVTVQLGRNPCALRGTAVQRLGGGRWEKGRKRRGREREREKKERKEGGWDGRTKLAMGQGRR